MLANANVTSLRVTAVVELSPVGAVPLVSVVIAAPHAANRNKMVTDLRRVTGKNRVAPA